MNRDDLLKKINETREAIKQFKAEGLGSTSLASEQAKIQLIKESSELFIMEARSIGAAGRTCPTCSGSGRVS